MNSLPGYFFRAGFLLEKMKVLKKGDRIVGNQRNHNICLLPKRKFFYRVQLVKKCGKEECAYNEKVTYDMQCTSGSCMALGMGKENQGGLL